MATEVKDVVCNFLLSQLKTHRANAGPVVRPLFVGLCGPQGSGKSYLSSAVETQLGQAPHKLKIVFLSLDDFYLPHDQLRNLKIKHVNNALLDGRGLPGTHDLPLGNSLLMALGRINTDRQTLHAPIYDKSKHAGLGDRSSDTRAVQGPVDIVVFEGWMVGFFPLPPTVLQEAYNASTIPNPVSVLKSKPIQGLDQPIYRRHSLASLQEINSYLEQYIQPLWSHLNALIRLVPQDMADTYAWRLQQEHTMKAKNGGKGMTDDQVRAFVTRYMPGYELFGSLKPDVDPQLIPWGDNTLLIEINKERRVVKTEP